METMDFNKVLLTTAYLPNIEYFAFMAKSEIFFLEDAENYQKQSYRNRTHILTANGVQVLILPTQHDTQRGAIREVRIDNSTAWQRKHWRAIESAYSGTPYFLYYKDFLLPFFGKKYEFLFDYNVALTDTLLQLFQIKKTPSFTETFCKTWDNITDLREQIHPKRMGLLQQTPYYQVFNDRMPFMENLSIIDLLFNIGADTNYLLQLSEL